MRFEYQQLLWLLLVLPPALVLFFWWSLRRRHELMTKFIQARLLPALTVGISPTRQKFRLGCLVAAAALLIIVLARPQWGYHYTEVEQRGLDIVVAIDTSKSMLAEDIAPNRLARAKLAALDLMQQAKSDRLGLVAFAGSAFLQCPMTSDDTAFRQSVDALNVNIIPQGGTALAEAISTALKAFKESDSYKVLVLFTDGEDNDQGALQAAETAAKQGLRIFTVGVGTAEGELLRITDSKGRTDYVRDDQGNVVKSHLNEELLQKIASATEGGFYLPLRGANTIDLLYKRGLEPLPKSEQAARLVRQYYERFQWPLAAAILLLLLEMLLPEQRLRRRRSQPVIAGRNVAAGAALVMSTILCPNLSYGSTASALREYNAGNYDQALREYQRMLQRHANDARLQYNAGAAAYRNRKLDDALKEFGRATTSQDIGLQQQAYYNLGNTLYRVGESLTNVDKKISSWEGALKQYDGAIKLNTNDADAKFNYEFVKKKLEELKKQQQQQQDQNKDQQKQDQQDKQQQAQNDQQDQQQGQDKQNQQNQSSNQQQEQQKQDQEQQAQNQSEEQKDQQEKEEQARSSAGGNEEKPEQQQGEQADASGMRPMTPQEAKQMLDAQKSDEQVLLFRPSEPQKQRNRTFKDW